MENLTADALSKVPEGSTVVGVVGASHVEGILDWWSRLTSGAEPEPEPAGRAAAPAGAGAGASGGGEASTSGAEERGVRRALLERALVISGAADIAEMMDELMGPLPESSWDAYEARACRNRGFT